MNIVQAVIEVLKDHDRPAHYKTIAREVSERKLVQDTPGQTMESLINARVGQDIRATERAGHPPRFQKLANGFIALTESAWDDETYADFDSSNEPLDDDDRDLSLDDEQRPSRKFDRDNGVNEPDEEDETEREDDDDYDDRPLTARDVYHFLDDYKHGVAEEFCRHINQIDFPTFERMVSQLIRSFHVRRSVIVNRRKDGGMDYAVNLGFFHNNLNLLVAVRRWGYRRNITLEDLKETMERIKQHGFNGLIFGTSGDFDDDVYRYVEEFVDYPVFLVHGERLAWAMMERGVGVNLSRVAMYSWHPPRRHGGGRERDHHRDNNRDRDHNRDRDVINEE